VLLDDMARARVDRDEWRRRVERWKDSGLTAKEFAAEVGINAGTLQFWRYKLKRDGRPARRPKTPSDAILSSLVEVRASAGAIVDQRFEIELGNGRRVRVAAGFEPEALRTLLTVLEAA
jgi:transposase-like protein